MNTYLLDDFEYTPEMASLVARAGLEEDSDEAEDFVGLANEIAARARPRAFVMTATVDMSLPAPACRLNDVEFSGSILYENIKDEKEVWPYVATCGMEMYEHVTKISDPFERFWGEMVLEDALGTAVRELDAFIAKEIFAGKSASIAPGSLVEWPIEQQTPLFALLGEGAKRCGVTLTDSLLMVPNKSVSGIRFHSEHGYVSCRFCPRDACPNRRAPYDPDAQNPGMM